MSRAASHQLVRHRIASYSQQSQRYVKVNSMPVIVPPSIAASEEAKADFLHHMQACENAYHRIAQLDAVAAEDARFVLPSAAATHIVMTMNFRSLLHFFEERLCNRAQWEIRDLAGQMFKLCVRHYPAIFENAGPKCRRLKFCPEAKPCGAAPWKN
jgi:thymidylate synthase (FAD)